MFEVSHACSQAPTLCVPVRCHGVRKVRLAEVQTDWPDHSKASGHWYGLSSIALQIWPRVIEHSVGHMITENHDWTIFSLSSAKKVRVRIGFGRGQSVLAATVQ